MSLPEDNATIAAPIEAGLILRTASILCRGDTAALSRWLHPRDNARSLGLCIGMIVAGCAAYGYTIGLWRGSLMAIYVAIKLPLLIFLVVLANGVLNGLFGQLLGTGLTFRQTLQTILISFTTFALILGALSPISFFMALNTPPSDAPDAHRWHGLTLLTHTLLIAYAGVIANLKMLRLMAAFSGNPKAAWRTFLAWTGGNLFVGAQLAYILRPFFGSPNLEIEFLREDPLNGTFYEAVYSSARNLFGVDAGALITLFVMMAIIGCLIVLSNWRSELESHSSIQHRKHHD